MKKLFDIGAPSEVIILLAIIVFSFYLAGGEYILKNVLSNPNPSSSGAEGDGSEGGTGGQNPTLPPNADGWKVELVDKGCDKDKKEAIYVANITGKTAGYMSVEVQGGDNSFATVTTKPFTNLPLSAYDLRLPNDLGFNAKPWRVRVFEGGKEVDTNFSGGTPKAVQNGAPTGCT